MIFCYVGDSVLNSSCDVVFAGLGFLFALKCRPRISLAVVLAMELGCLFWVRLLSAMSLLTSDAARTHN